MQTRVDSGNENEVDEYADQGSKISCFREYRFPNLRTTKAMCNCDSTIQRYCFTIERLETYFTWIRTSFVLIVCYNIPRPIGLIMFSGVIIMPSK